MKIYEMTNDQRIDYLIKSGNLTAGQANFLRTGKPISQDVADSLSENQIGTFGLPYGFATDFLVNGKEYLVPMSIEEPSVVAAASNGANRVKKSGGFTVKTSPHIIYGQIVLETNSTDKLEILQQNRQEIIDLATAARPSLQKRGGGVVSLTFEIVADWIEILIGVNTVDAMGANIVNSMLEAIAPHISKLTDTDVLCSILSNSGKSQLVDVEAKIDFDNLSTKKMSGKEVAERIVQLSQFSKHSVMRAVTQNKGIMNGIDAVLLATGNDFRAQEAAAHSFFATESGYQPFSDWQIMDDQLVGRLKMPVEIGTVGGAIKAMPMAQLSLAIMKINNSQELQAVIGAVGLANNLSAMRALVTTGIQAGHMSLQSKSLAISAGAVGSEIAAVSKELNRTKNYNLQEATKFLQKLRNE
ncbi:hydroxymethylglutaryl-CoA reductase, degradative [Companilactobacillus sp.]|jgi:hydroxymethylglutaryl-CoA reductase|uniref:hydroxymethylglutaryl-CoA reductase, degradative n=1 Tax=Companilactobacillus sp. TaxID=2767905 RepID=UPI0025C3619D|nr:hydroxymethylglutaryl-CoA reductase, degradative [Companilactobacillus sp.]MCH4008894.1 hydroxymethylglutaryl-CoA reductase, degradative [Companilactobacillus sp.]MCH4050927.1 hydroxymethylglutaryl-CoA reductase, degradative [Companilactobacillus sp.]MCH4076837.1 hydroxymethylglutaryl-CoA reductase, degradative [Companilactobacillus sp.]MCH4125412.1 hydroxymethylglutaryl-CoA reductase, degradative [Companilactobacillus sp.]MCH4131954.1 hydroxymethylglutaryl-CoA reductase, degradative [Compa